MYASVVIEETGLANWAAIEQWLDVVTALPVVRFYLVPSRHGSYPFSWETTALDGTSYVSLTGWKR